MKVNPYVVHLLAVPRTEGPRFEPVPVYRIEFAYNARDAFNQSLTNRVEGVDRRQNRSILWIRPPVEDRCPAGHLPDHVYDVDGEVYLQCGEEGCRDSWHINEEFADDAKPAD